MRIISVIILCLCFCNCKSQNKVFFDNLDNELTEYILQKSNKNSDEKQRYLNNEIKYLFESRKEFFSNFNLDKISEMNLIEILNPEMPSSMYTASLKINSKVYLFKRGVSSEDQFNKMDFDSFKKQHKMLACMLLEMDNTPNKLNDSQGDSSFHFTAFVTKINSDDSVFTYIPKNICSSIQ